MSDSISYIITIYNKAPCLAELVLSLKQQIGDFEQEFIFVDDGSTDGSFAILKALCRDWQNTIILSQANKGPGSAVNLGLRHATKKWVYLGDGDDYIYPDTSITLLKLIAKYNSALAHGKHSNDPAHDPKHYDARVTIYEDALAKAVVFHTIGTGTIIDRELVLQVGGCDERVFIQDYSLALRLARHTKFVVINRITARNIAKNQQRLSGNKLRENHDTAAARFLFIQDNLDIDYLYKYIALERQLRKSWLWYRKQSLIPRILSKHFLRYLITRIDFSYQDATIVRWLKESLEAYKPVA